MLSLDALCHHAIEINGCGIMRKLRALCVSAVPDFKGGTETVIKNMLANPYVESVLATPEDGPLADAARNLGVRCSIINPQLFWGLHRPPQLKPILAAIVDAFRCARRLRKAMRDHQCDLIHSHASNRMLLLPFLACSGEYQLLCICMTFPIAKLRVSSGGLLDFA